MPVPLLLSLALSRRPFSHPGSSAGTRGGASRTQYAAYLRAGSYLCQPPRLPQHVDAFSAIVVNSLHSQVCPCCAAFQTCSMSHGKLAATLSLAPSNLGVNDIAITETNSEGSELAN